MRARVAESSNRERVEDALAIGGENAGARVVHGKDD